MEDIEVTLQQVTFRIPEQLHARLKVVAAKERKTVQEIMAGFTEAYIVSRERQEAKEAERDV